MNIKYRPEIDGLRALAVLFVIFFHLDLQFKNFIIFKNGFFGVDIFFVISGFLITTIILKELYETKNFSFLFFYERRIRRIIPLFLVIGVSTSLLAWFFMIPSDFILLAKSFLSSAFFFSNVYFYDVTTDYFARNSELIPLLHTWSLSIEEQYYLVAPLIIFILFRVNKYLLVPVLLIFLIYSGNEAYEAIYKKNNFDYFFYSFLTRFWEILFGSVIAVIGYQIKIKSGFLSRLTPILSIFVIFIIVLKVEINKLNYFYNLMLIILSSGLFIFFSENNKFVLKVLGNKIIVFIGLLSYSLYLWHYPIISIYHIAPGNYFLTNQYMIILLILLLSVLSYNLVEKPFRSKNTNKQFKIKFKYIAILFVLSLIYFSSIIYYKGLPNRFAKINEFFENYQIDNKFLETNRREFLINKKKDFESKHKKVIVVGDSHSEDTFLMFELNKDLFKKYEFLHLDYSYIQKLNENDLFKKADIIIFSLRWHYRIDKKIIDIDEIFNSASFLKNIGKKIIITSNSNENYQDRYYRTWLDKYIMSNYFNLEDLKNVNFSILQSQKINLFENSNKLLREYTKKYDFIFLDKNDYLCKNKTECYVLTEKNEKIFYDYSHYTIEGAKFLGKKAFEINWLNLN